jgi:hypothetical protein
MSNRKRSQLRLLALDRALDFWLQQHRLTAIGWSVDGIVGMAEAFHGFLASGEPKPALKKWAESGVNAEEK